MHSLVVRARGLDFMGAVSSKPEAFQLKPETKLCEERGLYGCRKGLKTVPLVQALLSLKPTKTTRMNGRFINWFQDDRHQINLLFNQIPLENR